MNVPKPRKLPSGNYFIQLRLGGESISITERTAKECIHQAELAKAEYKVGKPVQKKAKEKAPTLSEAMDKYITARENVLSPSTIRGYKMIQNNRFKTVLSKPIDKIDWQKIINDEAKKCAPKTVRNAFEFVVSVLKEESLAAPRVTLPQITKNERNYLTYEEIPPFIAAIEGHPHELAMLLALHSLRRSEIYALRWEDMDLINKTIHVNGAYVLDDKGEFIRKPETKNTASNRIVPIFIDRLYYLLCEKQQKTGKVVEGYPGKLSENIKSVCKKNNLPIVSAHGLRHSFASLCYHLDVPERIAMRLGGWSDINTMHNIYVHLSDRDVNSYAQSLSDFYKNANENANGNL